jgi:bifunctional DNA-binding transcriptional regulator/antitoxin component of YhaV-PrlF toxin-antitoxin module
MSSKSVLSEVSFGPTMIQKMRRISLDANLLRTLGLEEGDSLDVALMIETGEIRLRKLSSGKRKQPSQNEGR